MYKIIFSIPLLSLINARETFSNIVKPLESPCSSRISRKLLEIPVCRSTFL